MWNHAGDVAGLLKVCPMLRICYVYVCMFVRTQTIIMIQIFVNNGYQEMDPAVGFVTATVNGIALGKSPLMKANDAIVYDGRDLVVFFF